MHTSVCLMLSYVRAYVLCMCLLIVPVFSLAGWGVWGLGGVRGEGGGVRTSSLRKLSVLQKQELQPVKTMRGTRETLAHGV